MRWVRVDLDVGARRILLLAARMRIGLEVLRWILLVKSNKQGL